jgi:hypothetical protein
MSTTTDDATAPNASERLHPIAGEFDMATAHYVRDGRVESRGASSEQTCGSMSCTSSSKICSGASK